MRRIQATANLAVLNLQTRDLYLVGTAQPVNLS